MKKIINGKKYDTETAKLICWYDINTLVRHNHIYENDLNFWSRNLYLKKTGEYFIWNERTQRHEDYDHLPEIQPLTNVDNAKIFAEKCDWFIKKEDDTRHDYESIFGVVEE